ncbi:MAG: ABC transporter permease [Anaerolineae bacterium]|nr:ABC transporter permease [Anaerolineae bacterium]
MAREVSLTSERKGIGLYWEVLRERVSRSPEAGAVFGFVAVLLFFVIATGLQYDAQGNIIGMRSPQILDARSVSSVVSNATSYGIIAVGVTILMIAGEFDLSVGSMLGFTALVFIIGADRGLGGLVQMLLPQDAVQSLGISYAPLPGLVAAAIALLTGAVMGLLNGLMVISTRIPSFIVTLGTLYIYRAFVLNTIPGGAIARYLQPPIIVQLHPLVVIGLAIGAVALVAFFSWPAVKFNLKKYRSGNGTFGPAIRLGLIGVVILAGAVIAVSIFLQYIGDLNNIVEVPFFTLLNGQLRDLPGNYLASILWWFLLAAVFTVALNQTRFGNAVFATGGNPGAARAQGINVRRVKVMAFMLSGTLAAVAGLMEAARFTVVEPLRGQGYELDVIAAVVIGGTLLTGGYGSIIGSVLGVLISGILRTGLVLINVDTNWFRGVLGAIMIGAVVINTNIRRQR